MYPGTSRYLSSECVNLTLKLKFVRSRTLRSESRNSSDWARMISIDNGVVWQPNRERPKDCFNAFECLPKLKREIAILRTRMYTLHRKGKLSTELTISADYIFFVKWTDLEEGNIPTVPEHRNLFSRAQSTVTFS